jgi:hypothetical protein
MYNELKNQALGTYKPDINEASKRWEAYWNGELLDRPVIVAACPKEGFAPKARLTYYDRVHKNIDEILDDTLYNIRGTHFLAESVPGFWTSFGPDELSAFCGGTLEWNDASNMDTNWSAPFIEDWEQYLPIEIIEDSPLWMRMLDVYQKAAELYNGSVLCMPVDFHSNMDLLLGIRGAEKLLLDCVDTPELVDRAMVCARDIFSFVWEKIRTAARMDEFGYWTGCYSEGSVNIISCDFSCMIGEEMFRRWVLPTIEYETSLVDHVFYHWDGPRALYQFEDLMGVEKIHTIGFVPDPFERRTQYIELYKRIQSAGKSVQVGGTIDELKLMHKELDPSRTLYRAQVATREEGERLIEWFEKNT